MTRFPFVGKFLLRQVRLAALLLVLAAVTAPASVRAASFSISPTSLELSGAAKSGAFTVMNSGSVKLNCQIEVKEWTQDGEGRDVYSDTVDIVFFPKIMTVEPNEQRAVRVGIKGPQGARERTYRLFVQEIPSQKKNQEEKTPGKITAGLTIAFRYATPIFVKPIKEEESAVIEQLGLSGGLVKATIRNTGNKRMKLASVTFVGKAIDGRELFSREVSGWYLLHGVTRKYEAPVPKEVCPELASIEVLAKAEGSTVSGVLAVQRNRCEE